MRRVEATRLPIEARATDKNGRLYATRALHAHGSLAYGPRGGLSYSIRPDDLWEVVPLDEFGMHAAGEVTYIPNEDIGEIH
jgi:hypothetical protein